MQNYVKIFPQWFLDPHNTRKQCRLKRLPNDFTFNLHGCQESFIVYNGIEYESWDSHVEIHAKLCSYLPTKDTSNHIT